MIQSYTLEERQHAFHELRDAKARFAAKNWFPGTSGNLSIRIGNELGDKLHFAVTSSGKDKSQVTAEDFLVVDHAGSPVEKTLLKPSAETLIHCEIYRNTNCGAIYHIHTVYNNLISELYGDKGYVTAKGIELIKAFQIWEENAEIRIPVLPNYTHIPRIADLIQSAIDPLIPGVLLRNHGIYAWGANAFEAKKHLEAFEFIFEYLYRWHLLHRM